MQTSNEHFLLICETCKGAEQANAIRDALTGQLSPGYSIRMVSCMAGCGRPTTVGFQAIDKAQYLFGDIETEQDIQALAEFAQQFEKSTDGWTNATDRPRPLFEKTLSRMPRIEMEVS